jgi:DNA repair exonuclease SbcCD ATPase subunit
MEIKKIVVEDFRSHTKAEVELAKVTVITGPNGSGKSSLIEAPATCLAGENTWTSRDSVALKNLIRSGQDQAIVSVVGKRTISRVITAKGSKIALDMTDPLTQPMLLSNLKVTQEQLRASLIPQAFLCLSRAEQKAAIFDLLAPKFTLETVGEHVPKSETWDKLCKRWSDDHTADEAVDLDHLYKFVYEARRAYKAKGKAAPAQENPRQKELVAKISELSKEIASGNFDNERRRIGLELKESVAAKEEKLAKGPKKRDLAALQTEWNLIDEAQREAECKVAAAEAVLKQTKVTGDKVEIAKGKVVCPIGLACPHDEKAMADRKNYLKGLEIAKSSEIKNAQAKLKDAGKLLAAKREEIRKAEAVNNEIAALEAEIKHGQSMGDIEDPVDIKGLEDQRSIVEDELSKLTSAAPSSTSAKVVEDLDAIVEALNVNGIKTTVIRKSVAALEKEVNEAIGRFGGWAIRFFVADEFAPTILREGGECLLGELSDGERAVLSLVIQDVFSRRSGINLVVVDNIDLLDERACGKFFETACKIASKVLVGTANATFVPSREGIKVHSLAATAPQKQAPRKPAQPPPVEDLL